MLVHRLRRWPNIEPTMGQYKSPAIPQEGVVRGRRGGGSAGKLHIQQVAGGAVFWQSASCLHLDRGRVKRCVWAYSDRSLAFVCRLQGSAVLRVEQTITRQWRHFSWDYRSRRRKATAGSVVLEQHHHCDPERTGGFFSNKEKVGLHLNELASISCGFLRIRRLTARPPAPVLVSSCRICPRS